MKNQRITPEFRRQRSQKAYTLRLKGLTYQEIGQEVGLTRQGAALASRRAERSSLASSADEHARIRRQHVRILTRIACVHLWEWHRSGHNPAYARELLDCLREVRCAAGIESDASYRRPVRPDKRLAKLDQFEKEVGEDLDVPDIMETVRRLEWSILGIRKDSGPDPSLDRLANAPGRD